MSTPAEVRHSDLLPAWYWPVAPAGVAAKAALALLVVVDAAHRALQIAAGPFPLQFDSWGYWQMASAIADGRGLLAADPTGFRTPAFPFFVASFRFLIGDSALQGIVVAQNVLGMVTALLTSWICRVGTGSPWAAVVGYALSAGCLGRIQYDQQLLSESLFIFLLVCHLTCGWRAAVRKSMPSAIAAGLSLGAAILTRPVALFLAPIELAALTCGQWRRPTSRDMRLAATLLVTAALPVSSWSARNAMIFGDFDLFRPLGVSVWEHTFRSQGGGLRLPQDREAALPAGLDSQNAWSVAAFLDSTGLSNQERAAWMEEAAREARRQAGLDYWVRLAASIARYWWENEEAQPFYVREEFTALPDGAAPVVWRNPDLAENWAPILRFFYRYPTWLQGLYSLISIAAASYLISCKSEFRLVGALSVSWLSYFALVTVAAMYPLYRFRMVLQPMMILTCVIAAFSVVRSSCRVREREGDLRPGDRATRAEVA